MYSYSITGHVYHLWVYYAHLNGFFFYFSVRYKIDGIYHSLFSSIEILKDFQTLKFVLDMSNSESKHVNLKFVELPSSCILGRFWNHKIFTDLNSTRPVFKNAPHMVWHTTLYLDDTVSTYNNQITKNFKQIDSQSESEIFDNSVIEAIGLDKLQWENLERNPWKSCFRFVSESLWYLHVHSLYYILLHSQSEVLPF